MTTLSNTFLRLAVIFALVGVSLGYGMGASGDHSLASAHAHINLLGWVSMFLYGLFYHAFPGASTGWMPTAHLWSAVLGFVVMTAALAVKLLGTASLTQVSSVGLIVGPTLVLIGMILWAVIVFRATSARA